jgi:hypothetical protein
LLRSFIVRIPEKTVDLSGDFGSNAVDHVLMPAVGPLSVPDHSPPSARNRLRSTALLKHSERSKYYAARNPVILHDLRD